MAEPQDFAKYIESLEQRIKTLEGQSPKKFEFGTAVLEGSENSPPATYVKLGWKPSKAAASECRANITNDGFQLFGTGSSRGGDAVLWIAIG